MRVTSVKFLDMVQVAGKRYIDLVQGQDGVSIDIPADWPGYVRLRYTQVRDDGPHRVSLYIPRERIVHAFGEEDGK